MEKITQNEKDSLNKIFDVLIEITNLKSAKDPAFKWVLFGASLCFIAYKHGKKGEQK